MSRAVLIFCGLIAASGCIGGRYELRRDEIARIRGFGPMPLIETVPAVGGAGGPLRWRAVPVNASDPELRPLVARLRETMDAAGGVGIAAPQVGVSRRVVLVMLGARGGAQEPRVEAMLNPALEWASPEAEEDWEACLSVPGVGALVSRARAIRVSFEALGGPRRVLVLEGFDARIALHEIDHLDGVLYTDKLAGPLVPIEEMRRRREEAASSRSDPPAVVPVETR